MRFKHAVITGIAVLALPAYAAFASLGDGELQSPKVEKPRGEKHASTLTHVHRHCHIVVTLGHAKRRCHTHRHNKIAHHGPRYH